MSSDLIVNEVICSYDGKKCYDIRSYGEKPSKFRTIIPM